MLVATNGCRKLIAILITGAGSDECVIFVNSLKLIIDNFLGLGILSIVSLITLLKVSGALIGINDTITAINFRNKFLDAVANRTLGVFESSIDLVDSLNKHASFR